MAGQEPIAPKDEPDTRPFFTKLQGNIDELYDEGKITVNGRSFITHLTSTYLGVRGFPETLLDLALPVLLFIVLEVPSDRGTILMSMVFTPWAMKPFFAILSDLFPLAYYKKRWYMAAVSCGGMLSAYMLFSSTPEQLGMKTANTAFFYFFMCNVAIAMCDSLSQGKYTEICKWKGSTVVSYVSACKTLAGTFAALVGPSINDNASLGPQFNMGIVIPFLGQAAVVQGLNFMGDRKLPTLCTPDMAIVQKDFKIIATGLLLGGFALSLTALQLTGYSDLLLPGATIGIIVILCMCFWSLPTAVARINVYIILCRIAAMDFRYVLQQWYTSKEIQCGPNTPHFPNTVYQMVGLVTANVMTLFGVWLFENYVYYWNAQKAFWVTTGFTIMAALFDLSMITTFNRTLWGFLPFMSGKVDWLCGDNCDPDGYRLDDLFGFLMGSQGIKYIATTLDDMPSTILLSKLCPAGVETTVFAMLAALMNLGLQFSGLLAARFLQYYEVSIGSSEIVNGTDSETEYMCNLGTSPIAGLSGLGWGIVVGGMILPALTIPATFFLIPNKPLNEKFVEEAPTEIEMAGAEPAHPAAAFARQSPSFDPLTNPDGEQLARRESLERASFLSLTRRGGAGGSRIL